MAQNRDTFEMLDTSPPKSPWGKYAALAVLVLGLGGVLAYAFWPGEEKQPLRPVAATAPAPVAPAKESAGAKETPVPSSSQAAAPQTGTAGPPAETITAKPVPPAESASAVPAAPTQKPAPAVAASVTGPEAATKSPAPAAAAPGSPAGGTKVTESMYFDFNQAAVSPAERKKLVKFLSDLQGEKGAIVLEGHTCALGPEAYNQELSEQRARQVANILKEQGLDKKYQLSVKGYGKTQPVADNQTPEGRAKNRRVMITCGQ